MANLVNIYDARFYAGQADTSYESATIAAPHIVKLFAPTSVVDIGCGVGSWLRAFADQGVAHFLGVDGPHVDPAALRIPREQFRPHDLRTPLPDLGRFDVAMSLEVAEHLPPSFAREFVAGLTRLAPVVVFSAAVPGQGGTDHINEQWPEYWEALFLERGYVQLDPLRPFIMHDERVEWWYRQNLFVYAAQERLAENAALAALPRSVGEDRMMLVSRRLLRHNLDFKNRLTLGKALSLLPRLIVRAFRH